MLRFFRAFVPLTLFLTLPFSASSMDLVWTRMTGQEPVETAPLITDFDGDGAPEITALNRTGQLMLWNLDGSNRGQGQDGTVCQLPEGRWPTTPTLVPGPGELRLLACNTDGLVVALDASFQVRWQYALPGKTTWARAVPLLIETLGGKACCLGDLSGTVTCLYLDGRIAWSVPLNEGPIQAPPQMMARENGEAAILVGAGSTLFCLSGGGEVLWRTDLGGAIVSRPEVLSLPDRRIIVCGAGEGSLLGLSLGGKVLWRADIDGAIDTAITVLPRPNAAPLILCAGLWGNLHAIEADGRPVWTHLYRAKTRTLPLVADVDGDGDHEILVSTYNQHLYAFDETGAMVDDVRLCGVISSSPTPVVDRASGRTDFLVTTAALLAYRIKPGPPTSPYGKTGAVKDVTLTAPATEWIETPSLAVSNPHGALLRVNLSLTDPTGWTRIVGTVTARSEFEIPLPTLLNEGTWTVKATARDALGVDVAAVAWDLAPGWRTAAKTAPEGRLSAWPTPAYASFDEERLTPYDHEYQRANETTVSAGTLYRGEAGQGAFILASSLDSTLRVRVVCEPLKREDGAIFDGAITARQVIPVATLNGERAADALPELGPAGLVTLSPRHAAKVWIRVDARGALPGAYTGRIALTPLKDGIAAPELTLRVNVLELEMPHEFPLELCTWDYVPNRWHPANTAGVLDDMARHGVTLFPRAQCVPKAQADAAGNLAFDWAELDAELDRLHGRGQLLLQVFTPPITFAAEPAAELKRKTQIAYLRALRDHLKERGWNYSDYALYPWDEPGLDYGKSIPALAEMLEVFREADPKLRIYTDPVPSLSWKDFERIEPLHDVWCPNMRLVSGLLSGDPRMRRIMDSGGPVWSYECVSQVRSLSPLRYNRANAWRAEYFGLQGIGFWTHSTNTIDPWAPQTDKEDEYALVYPGEGQPVPSVRWEAVRDGMEDIAAIKLLEQEIARNQQAGTRPEVTATAQEALRIARTDIMELSDPAYAESRDYLKKGDRRIWHTWTDLRVYEKHRARIAELTSSLR